MHIRSSPCPLKPHVAPEGMNNEQEEQLGRPFSNNEQGWFSVFDLLFPGHTPRPKSAYLDRSLTLQLDIFQDLMYAEGPEIIYNSIVSAGLHLSSVESEERDCAALFQVAIGEGLQAISQRWVQSYMEGSIGYLATPQRTEEGSQSPVEARTTIVSRPSSESFDNLEGYQLPERGQNEGQPAFAALNQEENWAAEILLGRLPSLQENNVGANSNNHTDAAQYLFDLESFDFNKLGDQQMHGFGPRNGLEDQFNL